MQCTCGFRYRKNRWHKNKNGPWSYGYQCYNILNNGSAKKRREAGADDTGYCDQPMIADWKLEMMGNYIMQQIWTTRADDIKLVLSLVKDCFTTTDNSGERNKTMLVSTISKLNAKKDRLVDMRTDGEISKEEFSRKKQEIDEKIKAVTLEYESIGSEDKNVENILEIEKIENTLKELTDFSNPILPREVYEKFVSRIVPHGKTHFRWYMNLDGTSPLAVDAKVEGTKKRPTVVFCDEGEIPPLHFGTILYFPIILKELKSKKSLQNTTLHKLRLLTKISKIR